MYFADGLTAKEHTGLRWSIARLVYNYRMVPRLYVPSLDARSRTTTLPEDEAAHVRRVLRVKVGQAVRLFDGRGGEVDARVISADRAGVVVEIGEPVVSALEWPVRVTLAQAVLKGDKIDDVIRDAVMMGVAAVQPLLTARTEVPEAAFSRGRRVERWQRIAVASAKQCGRAVVPHILAPCSLTACLAEARPGVRLMLVEPAATPSGASILGAGRRVRDGDAAGRPRGRLGGG